MIEVVIDGLTKFEVEVLNALAAEFGVSINELASLLVSCSLF